MILTRDDIIALLHGIMRFCDEHWMFADLDEDMKEEAFRDIDRFDAEDIAPGIIGFLEDNRDCLEEISWSIGVVLDYMNSSRRPVHEFAEISRG